MFIEHAVKYLGMLGYRIQKVENMEHASVCTKADGDHLQCTILINEETGQLLSINQTHALYESVGRHFVGQYRTIDTVLVFITKDIASVKHRVYAEDPYWIADCNSEHVIIYENQPSNSELEALLDACFDGKYGIVIPESIQQQKKNWWKNWWKHLLTVNTGLILLNILLFGVMIAVDFKHGNRYTLMKFGLVAMDMSSPLTWHRFLSAAFLHFDFGHLANNMFMLSAIGSYVEKKFGWWRYLVIYLFAGVIGNIATYFIFALQLRNYVSAGASGAIMGILGALLFLVIADRQYRTRFTMARVMIAVVLCVYSGFTTASTNNVAHIAGLISGFAISALLYLTLKEKRHE